MALNSTTRAQLMKVSTATLCTALFKRGLRNQFLQDVHPLRTGRANTALLDPITVEVYGSHMPLNQVASVSVPEPRMLAVQVWDKANVGPVDKGSARRGSASTRSSTASCSACRSPK